MIDREHLDNAGLYALDLLEGPEREAFASELRVSPELRAAVRRAEDHAAAVVLTLPPVPPPAAVLERIHRQIRLPRSRQRFAFPRPPAWIPWAAAAGFALLAGWSGWIAWRTAGVLRDIRQATAGETADGTAAGGLQTGGNPDPDRADSVINHTRRSSQGHVAALPEAVLRQETARLRTELERLRASPATGDAAPPGVADLRVLEMHPPGKEVDQNAPRELLSTRMAEAIAAGLEPGTRPPEETPVPVPPLRLSGAGAGADQDIVIEEGMVNLNALNLHPDAQVVHRNFPGEDDYAAYGLTKLDDSAVWDGLGWVWHRSADGGQWTGQRVPDGWLPPDPDDPAPVTPPTLRDAPERAPGESAAPEPATVKAADPWALPVIDQNGQGTLIVQDLPPAPEGQDYHFWMIDPRFPSPLEVGVLPPVTASADRFAFDLGGSGFLPTGYLLTLEPAGHSGAPGNRVILQGP